MKVRQRLRPLVFGVTATAIVAGSIGWAAAMFLGTAATAPPSRNYALATAHEGTVHEVIPFRAGIEWEVSPAGRNDGTGVVTSVDTDFSRETHSGQQIYSIDLRPVVVAGGSTPMFRELSEGAHGPDVQQLQKMLSGIDFYGGSADGLFGPATREAVKAWQKRNGLDTTGVVEGRDIVFVPKLPAFVRPDPSTVAVGRTLVGGEVALQIRAPTPRIRAILSVDQRRNVSIGTPVTLSTRETSWSGKIRSLTPREDRSVEAEIVARDDQPCQAPCLIPQLGGQSTDVDGVATVIPKTRGVIIPTIAILSKDSRTFVIDVAGKKRWVKIIVSAVGDSIVTGLPVGTKVRVVA